MKLGSIYFAGFSVLLLIGALCGAAYGAEPDRVYISEVNVSKTAAYDDNGDYAPYIEIYNSSDLSMNLKGWGLSDDKDSPYKYSFPKASLPPGKTVIVWLNRDPDDERISLPDYVPRDIHTKSITVSAGSVCLLTDARRQRLSEVVIPDDIPQGKSYATCLRHAGKYAVAEPDPYRVREDFAPPEPEVSLPEPRYSLAGGCYAEGTEISIESAGDKPLGDMPQEGGSSGKIYYTLDGSVPDETSAVYDGPIILRNRSDEENIYSSISGISLDDPYMPDYRVDKCTVLKSVVIEDGKRSPVKTETYFVGLQDKAYDDMPAVSITMDPKDLFDKDRGIYVLGKVYDTQLEKYGEADPGEDANYAMSGKGWERGAKIEYFSPEKKKLFEQNIGIRIHGGYSTAYNQKSFNLYARDENGNDSTFRYDVYNDTEGNGICNKLVLRSGGEIEMYVTKMRDVLLQSFMDESDVGIQRAVPCNVFLNGEYWGMYNLQEAVSDCYVEEHYGTGKGNALIVKNWEPNKAGEEHIGDYYDMMSFIQDNDMAEEDNYEYAKELIDIKSCIDFYAAEIYFANADQYSNVAAWRAIEPEDEGYNDGRWRWLLYDLDESAGLITRLNPAEADSFMYGHWGSAPLNGDPFFSSLMRNEEFRTEFIDTFTELAENNFSYENTSKRLNDMADIYRRSVIKSHNRFKGDIKAPGYEPDEGYEPPYNEEDFERDIEVIDDFLRERAGFILEYMKQDIGTK